MLGYSNWERNGIIYIYHLLDAEAGHFLSLTQLQDKYSIPIDVMKYNSIVSAIPQTWKFIIRNTVKPIVVEQNEAGEDNIPRLCHKGQLVPLTCLRNKDLYAIFVQIKFQSPTAIAKWCSLYPQLLDANWDEIFTLPYSLVTNFSI